MCGERRGGKTALNARFFSVVGKSFMTKAKEPGLCIKLVAQNGDVSGEIDLWEARKFRPAQNSTFAERWVRPSASTAPTRLGIDGFLAWREGHVPETGVFSDLAPRASRNRRDSPGRRGNCPGIGNLLAAGGSVAGERPGFQDARTPEPGNLAISGTANHRTARNPAIPGQQPAPPHTKKGRIAAAPVLASPRPPRAPPCAACGSAAPPPRA